MENGRQAAHLLQLQGSWGCLSLWSIRKTACQALSNAWLEHELHVADAATIARQCMRPAAETQKGSHLQKAGFLDGSGLPQLGYWFCFSPMLVACSATTRNIISQTLPI